jgi:hypothetical protein
MTDMRAFEASQLPTVTVKQQTTPFVPFISVSASASACFNRGLAETNHQQMRFGILYGRFERPRYNADGVVLDGDENARGTMVDAIYEPPQAFDPDVGVTLLHDPDAQRVETIAGLMQLVRVGYIISHKPRDFALSGAELIHVARTAVAVGIKGAKRGTAILVAIPSEAGHVAYEAFQPSKQCLRLVRDGVLTHDLNRMDFVRSTCPLRVAKQPTHAIDTHYFTVPIAIRAHTGPLRSDFSPKHRHIQPSQHDLAAVLMAAGPEDSISRVFGDFHLLLFIALSGVLAEEDVAVIATSVAAQSQEPAYGFVLLLKSFLGLA